jgi:hypothetical protein
MCQGDRRIGGRQLIGAAGGAVTTPGYSGRPQAVKLGLKPGQRVSLHQPPRDWALTDPPDGLEAPGPDGQADVIVAFFTEAGDIAAQIGELGRLIYPAGALWVAWPRRAAGHRSDIKVAAIDDDWSGLRLVWRVENR